MKRDFDREAAQWDNNPTRLAMTLAISQAMIDRLSPEPHQTVLDYGAGTGVMALKFSPLVGRVIAADSSRGMLDVMRTKLAALGVDNVQPRLLDLAQDGSDDASLRADIVVCSMTFHHVKDTGALARRFHAMLPVGGRVAVADLEPEPGDFHSDNAGVEHFGFQRAMIEGQFSDAGFSEIQTATAYTMRKTNAAGVERRFPIFLLTARRA